jgi:hypothetical protein
VRTRRDLLRRLRLSLQGPTGGGSPAAKRRGRERTGLRLVWACVAFPLFVGCAMDREEVLKNKTCEPDGTCAFGYRCRDGTCVPDGQEGRRASALSRATALADAALDAGSTWDPE